MERIRRSTKRLAAWVAGLVCAAVIAPVALEAQSVNFAGSQTTVAGGFADVVSIAADSNGNIYVADFANSVVQEIVAVNGSIPASPTIRTLGSGFFGPRGVAVDASGNVYVGDTKDNQVKEIVAVNGSIPAAPTILTLGSGFNLPTGVVVDAAGDVFVADFGTNAVKEILAVNGSIPASPTIVTFDSEFGGPGGLALDSTGNLYVAATTSGLVQEILAVNGSIPASPAILTLTSDLSDLLGVAVDSTGNIYVSATFVDEVQEIVAVNGSIPASPTILSLGVGLGGESGIALDPSGNIYTGGNHSGLVIELQTKAINVGSAAAATPTPVSVALAFNFDAGGSIAAPVVLTQGATGLDFTDAGTGTCTTNGVSHIYNAGDSCTVNVTFAPRLPGARNGAVEIVDASGNVLATSLVYGTGDGPQIAFSPPAQSTISSGLSYPYGVAVDGSGNLYIVDSGNDRVLKETLGGGSYTQSTIVSGLNNPWGVAVDGSGNVYIVDSGNQRVLKETLSGGSYTQSTISSGLYEPHGVAVDGSGNLYIADTNNNRVLKETPSGGSYTQSTIGNGLNGPYGVAVDASGNVYISAVWGNDVLKETLNGSSYIQSTVASSLDQPLGVAVDGGGNVYIDDTYNNRVLKEALSGGSYTQSTVGSGLSFPFGVATDGSGNIYISDTSHQRVLKEDYADPSSLSFAATVVGSTSSDSPQSVTVENIGNANLTGSVNSISASFAQVDGPGTPADCAQSFSIAPGSACNLGLGFTPLSVGSIPGSATLFSNSLNGTQVQSQIELAGTGQQTPPVVTGISPSQGSLAGGTVVTITGTSFNGAKAVRFGSSPATSLSVKDTTIIATAPAEAAGTVDVTVTTQSGTSVTSAADRFTYVNPLTAAQSIASAALTQNHAASSFTPVTGSGGTAPFAYSVSPALPTGLSFNASTGAISGTPTATHALSSFTVSITDVNGANATNSFSLTVNPAVLAAQAAPSVALTYSSAANVTPVTGSGGTPPLSYSVIPVLPVGLSFNTSTGAITGTPTAVINSANYAVTVTDANGASASNTFSLSVGKATATVTLSNLAQIYTGSALSATAATNPANLSVSFTYNGSAAAPTAAGSYTVVATIASGGNYTGTATGTLVISPATASTLLTAATLTPTPGQSDLLTATVAGAGSLSGLVVFKAGATAICTTTVNAAGVAVCSYTPGITGAVQVSAQYQADSNHTSSNVATVTLNVAATYDAAITVQYASTQLVYPGATNITVCIAPAHNITATGSVQIYDGTTLLTTLSVQGGGCAYWYISPGLAAGNHVLTAVYSGDKNNPGGTSAPTTIHVAPVPVNMAPSCWLTNSGYGANYQCTVSLSSNAGSAQGVMTYSYDGGTAVSVAINNGTANFTLTRPAAGKHSVQIAYAQQTNYAVAGPVTENFTVAPAQVQVALTPSSWYTSASGGISFAAAVNSSSPGAPSSNGSVEFFDGNTLLATVPVNANGQASFSTTKLAAGSHTIAATYSGGVNYASSSSSVTITLTP